VEAQRELYERWVSPLYMRLLHGNFLGDLLADPLSDNRTEMISRFRSRVADVDPSIVATLIHQREWRARLTGSWLAGLRGWRRFSHEIGTMLVESQMCFACQGYCAALACYADQASADHLRRYLDTWLPQVDKYYDQHWALPALAWIDQRLDTQYAAEYLVSGGLWDRWATAQHREGPPFYAKSQRQFDLTLSSALAAFRSV